MLRSQEQNYLTEYHTSPNLEIEGWIVTRVLPGIDGAVPVTFLVHRRTVYHTYL